MVFLLRSILSTTTAVAVSALPTIAAFAYLSPSSSSQFFRTTDLKLLFPTSSVRPIRLGLVRSFTLQSPLNMDIRASNQEASDLPELLTEFMVDMKCDGCVNTVKNKLQTVSGIKTFEVDLSSQVVRILGSSPVRVMTDALEQTGRKTRLIGQGIPGDFQVSAAVAEFKGPVIFGVVRFAQVNMKLTRIEASLSGLIHGKHGWSINEYGDLTNGAASTGNIFNPLNEGSGKEALGILGTLDADENGNASLSISKPMLKVEDVIGRSVVVYENEHKSDCGATAAVIARSAGVGENYKKICTCDGTSIWDSSGAPDFVTSKV